MNYVVYKYLMISSMVGGVACMAAILAYSFRGVLRRLLEKWLRLGPGGRVLSLLFFTVGILFGGSKNGVQGLGIREEGEEVTSGQWLVVREEGLGLDGLTGKRNPFRLGEEERFLFEDEADGNPLPLCVPPSQTPPSQTSQTTYQTVTSWSSRGAFCDWTRVEFPDSFAFPVGTNLITGVTVMAYGEVRESLRTLPALFALPAAVSLEPGVSAFSHGLTASNSYVFAWTDCCIEREATNRVNASIELFQNGDAVMRFGEMVTNIVAALPEGYVGVGQNDDWIAAAFPNEYAAITNKGYETWLMEDCVGINCPNGLGKVSVTIAALPEQGPCYLEVGPHRMVVTQPGTYSFPLEVFVEYHARTYPVAVPLTFDWDDGYRVDPVPGLYMSRSAAPRRQSSDNSENDYYLMFEGKIYCTPSWIDLSSAAGREIQLSINATHVSRVEYESSDPGLVMALRGLTRAEFIHVYLGCSITFMAQCGNHTAYGSVRVHDSWPPYLPDTDPDNNSSSNGVNDVSTSNTTSTATMP